MAMGNWGWMDGLGGWLVAGGFAATFSITRLGWVRNMHIKIIVAELGQRNKILVFFYLVERYALYDVKLIRDMRV
jgi:hypothetical protein